MTTQKASALAVALCLSFFAAGCKKKVGVGPMPKAPVAEAPPPKVVVARPIVKFFTAEPTTIERGQASSLKWEVTGAESVSINQGLGVVGNAAAGGATPAVISGNRSVFPSDTTTYTLTATNSGGSVTEAVTVNVTAPPPPPPPVAPQPKALFSEVVARDIQDAYFDFDKSDLREDARNTLTQNADKLKTIFRDYPNGTVTIEGHADERGSAEYNLGLGDRRAIAAKDFLVQLGVPGDRLRTLSYGKERPQCTDNNESCWQKNRRAHFTGQ
ncbi:MAG: OmpA family protein [Acidobacteria bacterium]|nr:OmpA family protein [Acidobacteriota bacterium]